jgi:hypothetical protein
MDSAKFFSILGHLAGNDVMGTSNNVGFLRVINRYR